MQTETLRQKIYDEMKTPLPRARREVILEQMKSLSEKKIHCFNCTGTCCTMSANSMQVTPLEALEVILSLEVTPENLAELKMTLKENITHFRLDHEISLGKKAHTHLRKTYTCPFFVPGPKGCRIKKDLKPYGCLGFNPKIENDNGSSCHSDQDLLQKRETQNLESENAANAYLKQTFQIDWSKLELPKAIFVMLEKIYESKK